MLLENCYLILLPESIRSLPEWMQPEQILKFDHVVNMSVEKDTAAVRHLATKIRDLLDLHADLQQSELGKSSLMALEPRCQLDREKHIQRSNSEHQSQILIWVPSLISSLTNTTLMLCSILDDMFFIFYQILIHPLDGRANSSQIRPCWTWEVNIVCTAKYF